VTVISEGLTVVSRSSYGITILVLKWTRIFFKQNEIDFKLNFLRNYSMAPATISRIDE